VRVRQKVVRVADTDVTLVSRCRSADGQAFNEIVHRYKDRVFAYVRRMVENREDAEDIAQETFVRVFTGLRSFENRASLPTWLYRIATNLCIDYRRRNMRPEKRHVPLDHGFGDAGPTSTLDLADERYRPDDVAARNELATRLDEAILALPERLRAVVVLHDVNGVPYEDVARIVGCPLGTVKSRLFHARSALRDALGPYLRGEDAPPPKVRRGDAR
jgi:RNA polymerase sigma-70 factor (ECF subfamily)